jgi:hypothetical protein
MKKIQTFEEYLQVQFSGLHPEVLDDDLPEKFNAWLEQLDVEELIDYADVYGAKCYTEGKSN